VALIWRDGAPLFEYAGGIAHRGHGVAITNETDTAGADPGVSTMVSHHVLAGTTIVVLCNQDRGSWAAVARLTKELGLSDPRDVAEAQG